MPTCFSETTRRAAKDYYCQMCGARINVGDHHRVSVNHFDGRVYNFRECMACTRDLIVGTVYGWAGDPWEGVTAEDACEWARDAAIRSDTGAERWAARNWLARVYGGEGE